MIFSLVNNRRIHKGDFENLEDGSGGTYLNNAGKKIFIEEFEEKMESKITFKGKEMSYRQLISAQLQGFQNYIMKGDEYVLYKNY